MRREFLKGLIAVPALAALDELVVHLPVPSQREIQREGGPRLKVGLNAYSFNGPLTDKSMTLEDLLVFCASLGLDAVDITAYYFPGYPVPPPEDVLYSIKKKAFLLGLDISGTGVRNDFTHPDEARRREEVDLVKRWIDAAAKLGAPVIRIFAGKQDPPGYSWERIAEWMVKDIRECVEYGKRRGVIVAIQNHNDFIKTAEHVRRILTMVDSEWSGLILDTGSYRENDPYEEIAATARYAVNWQIKEQVYINNVPVDVDLGKLMKIIQTSGYRGYLPVETLGAGDPREKVPRFVERVRSALS